MPTLRQGTLSFASTKRTASASIAKGKKFSHPTVVPVAKRSVSVDTISVGSTRPSWSDRDESDVDDIVVSDESGSEVHRPLKKLKIDDGKAEAVHKGKGKEVARLKEGARKVEAASAGVDASATKENLDVLQKSGKLRKHYALVSVKMGHLEPVHGEGQSTVHHILRVFDLSYEYGPCVGVSRLERWQRAEALGLNPPPEVREILLTKQASEQEELSRPVFHAFEI